MNISPFMMINLLVGAILAILVLRFVWNMYFSTAYLPAEWQKARKSGTVGGRLASLARRYPDRVRFFAWWLQTERLKRERVPGAFAEVGVYKGESARVIHCMDPDREFHLFDSFEGFPGHDLAAETGEAAAYTTRHFADTHVRHVLKKIGGNGNIIIHKGHFPESARGLEETAFALVNIDADLYQPTRAALDFFFPRLSPGGVIFIHDHNHRWQGVMRAVDEFTAGTGEIPVLIPDADSTVVFVKRKK